MTFKSQRGSSLVEVILAVTLFALIASSFWIAIREHDKLLKHAEQYSDLDMRMDVLASMIRDTFQDFNPTPPEQDGGADPENNNPVIDTPTPQLDDHWRFEPEYSKLIAQFNLHIIGPEDMTFTMFVGDPLGVEETYQLTAPMYTVVAEESNRTFNKKVLVNNP